MERQAIDRANPVFRTCSTLVVKDDVQLLSTRWMEPANVVHGRPRRRDDEICARQKHRSDQGDAKKPAPKKRKISPAARKRMAEATRKRWAEYRAKKAKSQSA